MFTAVKENFVNILSCEVGVTSSACCWSICYLLCWFWRLASIQGYVNPSTKVGSALTIMLIWSHHRCGPGSLIMCHWRTGAWLRQAFSHDPFAVLYSTACPSVTAAQCLTTSSSALLFLDWCRNWKKVNVQAVMFWQCRILITHAGPWLCDADYRDIDEHWRSRQGAGLCWES